MLFRSASCCSIFKVLSSPSELSLFLSEQLIYYSMLFSVCQEVFQKFFRTFFFRSFLSFGLLRPLGRFWLTLILYHIFCGLSRGFAKVFQKIFSGLPPHRLAHHITPASGGSSKKCTKIEQNLWQKSSELFIDFREALNYNRSSSEPKGGGEER